MVAKDMFCQNMVFKFLFYGKCKSHLFILLFSYSQFVDMKDCVKQKKGNASYNQCLLSLTNELSSNLNKKFRSSLVQNVNFKL